MTSLDETSDQSSQTRGGNATVNGEKVNVGTAEHLEGGTQILAPTTTYTLEEEKRVIRSLDCHIMPLIFVLYSLNVLDRSNLGNARIAGLDDDLNLTSQQYNWLATVFYIACEFSLPALSCPAIKFELSTRGITVLQTVYRFADLISKTSCPNGPNSAGKPSSHIIG